MSDGKDLFFSVFEPDGPLWLKMNDPENGEAGEDEDAVPAEGNLASAAAVQLEADDGIRT